MVDTVVLQQAERETDRHLHAHGQPTTYVELRPAGHNRIRVFLRDADAESPSPSIAFDVEAGPHPSSKGLARRIVSRIPKLRGLQSGRWTV